MFLKSSNVGKLNFGSISQKNQFGLNVSQKWMCYFLTAISKLIIRGCSAPMESQRQKWVKQTSSYKYLDYLHLFKN
jgi:hypothetical protein